MARGEVTGCKPAETPTARTPATRQRAPAPAAAYTVPEFCDAHRISEAMYYKLKAQGLGPDEMEYGTRRAISFEAAARWRAARETKETAA